MIGIYHSTVSCKDDTPLRCLHNGWMKWMLVAVTVVTCLLMCTLTRKSHNVSKSHSDDDRAKSHQDEKGGIESRGLTVQKKNIHDR